MAYCTPKQILSGGFPGPIYHPSDSNEGKWEVRSGDRYKSEERYGCGRVAPRPKVNWDKGKRGGKEWEIHERREHLRKRIRELRMNVSLGR